MQLIRNNKLLPSSFHIAIPIEVTRPWAEHYQSAEDPAGRNTATRDQWHVKKGVKRMMARLMTVSFPSSCMGSQRRRTQEVRTNGEVVVSNTAQCCFTCCSCVSTNWQNKLKKCARKQPNCVSHSIYTFVASSMPRIWMGKQNLPWKHTTGFAIIATNQACVPGTFVRI